MSFVITESKFVINYRTVKYIVRTISNAIMYMQELCKVQLHYFIGDYLSVEEFLVIYTVIKSIKTASESTV